MNDYLWDQTGHDPELEALEASLAGFAYERPAPALPLAPVLQLLRPSPPLAPVRAPTHRPGAPWVFSRATPLALAAAMLLLGSGVTFLALEKAERDVRKGWNLVPVVVASADLSEGSVVTAELLSQRSVPEQFVTASVIKPDSASYVVGQRVTVAVAAGDPLLWSQFEASRGMERLAAQVMKRARALAVGVNGLAAVGGWVRPNDHVDVIGTFKDPATNEPVAVTLMQNVTVLTTGKQSSRTNVNLLPEAERTFGDVSLMVLPEEAELLTLAGQVGQLTFTLRNDEDLDVLDERGRTTLQTLLSGERQKVLQQKRLNTIQVIRGASPAPAKPRP